MAGKELALEMVLKLKDQMSGELDKPTSKLKTLGETAAKLAIGGAVAGVAALTGALIVSVKAAAEEEVGIARLAAAVTASGGNWAGASKDIEAYLAAELKRTALDDGIGRESISRLTTITGDYRKALELMPLAQDLARAKGMDLATAAEIVGKVSQGNTGILSRYGVVLKEGATATEAIAAMQQKFGGQAEAYGNTYAGQMDKLQISFGNIKETIGAALLPMVTQAAGAFTDWLTSPAIQAGITSITTGLTNIVAALTPIKTWLVDNVLPAAKEFSSFLEANMGPILLGLAVTIGTLVVPALVAWASAAAAAALSTLIALAPLVAIGAVVALLAIAWNKDFLGIKTTVMAFYEGTIKPIAEAIRVWLAVNLPVVLATLRGIWEAAWAAIVTAVNVVLGLPATIAGAITSIQTKIAEVMASIKLAWDTAWGGVKTTVETLWDQIKAGVQTRIDAVKAVIDAALLAIKTAWDTAWGTLKTAAETVWGVIKGAAKVFVDALHTIFLIAFGLLVLAWEAVWGKIKTALDPVWQAIKGIVETAINAVKSKIDEVMATVKSAWESVWGTIKSALDPILGQIKDAVASAISSVKSKLDEVMATVKSAWDTAWTGVKDAAKTVWDEIKDAVTITIGAVKDKLDEIMATVKTAWDTAWGGIKDAAKTIWDTIKKDTTSAINAVKDKIVEVMGLLKTTWDKAWSTISEPVVKALEAVQTSVSQGVQNVVTWITDNVDKFTGIGRDIVLGMVKGIVDSVEDFKNAIINAINAAIAAAKRALKEKSPSEVFAEMGYNMMEGLAQGIERGAGAPVQALQQLFLAPAVGLITQFAGIIGQLMSLFWEVGAEESLNRVRLVMDTIKDISDTIMSAIAAAAAIAGKTADLDALAIEMTTLFRSLRAAMLTIINEVRWFDTQDIGVAGKLVGVYQAIIAPLKEAFVITREFKGVTIDAAALGATAVAFFGAMDEVVRAIRDAAERVGIEGLGAANAFAVTVAAVVGVISSGVTALITLIGYKTVADFAARAAIFAADLVTGVTAIKDALVKVTDLKPYEAASAWATAIGPAVAVIKPAIDALVALAEYKPVTGIAAKMKTIADQIGTAILEFARVTTWRETMKPWETAGVWATAVTSAVGLVKGVVDALTALGEYKPVTGIAAKMTTIANQIATAILEFARVATWRETMKPWETAGEWATAVASAVGLIKGVVDALTALGAYKPVVGIAAKMTTIADQIGTAILEFARVVAWRETMKPWETAGEWATKVGPAVNLIKGAVDALAALAAYKPVENLVEKAALFATQLADALDQMIEGIEVIGRSTESWTKASTWATAVGPAVNLIKGAVDALANLVKYEPVENLVEKAAFFGTQLADALDQMIEGIEVVGRSIGSWTGLGDWARAVSPVFGIFKGAVDALVALATYEPVAGLDTLATNMFNILGKVLYELDYAIKHWSKYVQDWTTASTWATAVRPALDAIKSMVDGLTALAEYKPVAGLDTLATIMFSILGKVLYELDYAVKHWSEYVKDWTIGSAFATAIGPAVNGIRGMVDALTALAEYEPAVGLKDKAAVLFDNITAALAEMKRAVDYWTPIVVDWAVGSTWATAVKPAIDIIKGAVDAMLALATYVEPADMAARITAFVAALSLALSQIATAAATKAPEIWTAAGVFATNIFPAVALMKAGLEALDALADFGTEYISPEKIDVFVDIIRYTVEMIAWLSYQIAPVAVQAAAAFATQTQAVWQSMKDALAFLGDLNAAALPNEEKVNAFVATLTRLLNALGTALGTSADIAATTGAIAANLTNAGNIDIPPLVPGSLPHPMPNLDWTGIIGRPRTTTGGGAGGGGGGGGGAAALTDRVYDILVEIRDILAEELALGSSRTTLATREAILDAMGPIVSESLRRQARRGVAA